MHPPTLLVKDAFAGREKCQIGGKVRTKLITSLLRFLLNRVRLLQKSNLIEVTSSPSQDWQSPQLENEGVERICWESVRSPMLLFGYNPRFILSHFVRFFDQNGAKSAEV